MIVGSAILLPAGSGAVVTPLTVTENGIYTPPEGVDGYSMVIAGVTVRSPRCDQMVTFDWATEQTYMAWMDGTPVPRPVPPTPEPLPGPSVAFSSGTDEEIAAAIDAARAGTIDLQNGEHAWHVGDTRSVHLSAWTGGIAGWPREEVQHPAEDLRIAISQFGDYMSCGSVMQFDFVDYANGNVLMNDSNTSAGGYGATLICTDVLPKMAEALPAWLKTRLKTFSVLATAGSGSNVVVTVPGNKLALRSEMEVFGSVSRSMAAEGTQVPYYTTAANRIKRRPGSETDGHWWERSPSYNFDGGLNAAFCMVVANGESGYYGAASAVGLAPFGCV